jgi:hypothetical protein
MLCTCEMITQTKHELNLEFPGIGFSDIERTQARELVVKHEKAFSALLDFRNTYCLALDKMRVAMSAIYSLGLDMKAQGIFMRAAGFPESRISEFKRIINDTQANFEKFINGDVTYRLALENARGTVAPGSVVNEAPPPLVEWAQAAVAALPSSNLKKKYIFDRVVGNYTVKITIRAKRVTKPKVSKTAKKKDKK